MIEQIHNLVCLGIKKGMMSHFKFNENLSPLIKISPPKLHGAPLSYGASSGPKHVH